MWGTVLGYLVWLRGGAHVDVWFGGIRIGMRGEQVYCNVVFVVL